MRKMHALLRREGWDIGRDRTARLMKRAGTLRAKVLPSQALNMAAWGARGSLDDLVHHADHGSNYLSVVYTDRINDAWRDPVDRERR